MGYHFGKKSYVTIEKQTAAGTAASTVVQGINVTEMPSLAPKIEKKTLQLYKKQGGESSDFVVNKISAEGDITAPATPGSGLEYMLEGVLGVDTPVDGTGYFTHTYTVADDLPYYTVLIGHDALAVESYKDVQFGSLNLSMQPNNEIVAKAGVQGTPIGIATAEVTPTYGTEPPFTFYDLGVSIGGTPNCDVLDMDLTIDRGMKSVRTACAASSVADNVRYATTTKVSGNISMFFQDYTEYKYWLGASNATAPDENQSVSTTARALKIELIGAVIDTGPNVYSKLTIDIPKAVYTDAIIESPYDDRMMIKLPFEVYYDATQSAGEQMLQVELISELSATVAS